MPSQMRGIHCAIITGLCDVVRAVVSLAYHAFCSLNLVSLCPTACRMCRTVPGMRPDTTPVVRVTYDCRISTDCRTVH